MESFGFCSCSLFSNIRLAHWPEPLYHTWGSLRSGGTIRESCKSTSDHVQSGGSGAVGPTANQRARLICTWFMSELRKRAIYRSSEQSCWMWLWPAVRDIKVWEDVNSCCCLQAGLQLQTRFSSDPHHRWGRVHWTWTHDADQSWSISFLLQSAEVQSCRGMFSSLDVSTCFCTRNGLKSACRLFFCFRTRSESSEIEKKRKLTALCILFRFSVWKQKKNFWYQSARFCTGGLPWSGWVWLVHESPGFLIQMFILDHSQVRGLH